MPPVLTVAAFTRLRGYGDAIRAAGLTGARDDIIVVALHACGGHHRDGIPWTALATAMGVGPRTLHRWRGQYGPGLKNFGRVNQTVLAVESVRRATREPLELRNRPHGSPSRPGILHLTGHPKPGGNDFGTEMAMVRNRVTPYGVPFEEHSCVELADLTDLTVASRPTVLHVSAHSTLGGVVLADDGAPFTVEVASLVTQILACAALRPTLVVLNICDSYHAARELADGIPCVVGWAGPVSDEQGADFSGHFYRRLAAGTPAGDAHEKATLVARARWPSLRPVIVGDTSITPLAW